MKINQLNKMFSGVMLVLIILGASVFDVHGQTVVVSPNTLYMGQIPLESKANRLIQIFNTGSATLEVSSVSIVGADSEHFEILNNPGSFSLSLASQKALEIQYYPKSNESHEVEIVITSNAAESPNKVPLLGSSSGLTPFGFERIFGSDGSDVISSVCEVDGGYLLAGSTLPSDLDFSDILVTKTNKKGEILWQSQVEENESENARTIIEAGDGSFYVFGETNSKGKGRIDFYLIKFNSSGVLQWDETYGGAKNDFAGYMIQTDDGGFIMVGGSLSFGNTENTDVYVVKVDSDGKEQWSKQFGADNGDSANKIIKSSSGQYYIIGSTASSGSGGFDIWLLKIDDSGNLIWEKTFGGNEDDEGNDLVELNDGSLVLVGYTISFGSGAKDAYIFKVDQNGNKVWEILEGGIYQDAASSVTSDGERIYYTSSIKEEGNIGKLNVVSIDLNGQELWRSIFQGKFSDMLINADGHLVLGGSTGQYSNKSDAYFLNLNQNGEVTGIQDLVFEETIVLSLYPTLTDHKAILDLTIPKRSIYNISVYNLNGVKVKEIYNGSLQEGHYTFPINASSLIRGQYICTVKSNRKIVSKKFIKI